MNRWHEIGKAAATYLQTQFIDLVTQSKTPSKQNQQKEQRKRPANPSTLEIIEQSRRHIFSGTGEKKPPIRRTGNGVRKKRTRTPNPQNSLVHIIGRFLRHFDDLLFGGRQCDELIKVGVLAADQRIQVLCPLVLKQKLRFVG